MTRRWPLATRLSIYFFALLVMLQLVTLGFYRGELDGQRRERVASATRVGQNAAAAVGAFVQDVESSALAMALAIAAQPAIDQATSGGYLAAVLAAQPYLRSIFVTDRGGRVLASSGSGVGVDLSERPYLRALVSGSEKVWSGSLTGLESGEITVAYGRHIAVAPGADARGYLIFAFHPDRLLGALGIAVAPDAQLTLTDANGLVIYDSRRPALSAAQRDLSGLAEVRRALSGEIVQIVDTALPYPDDRRYGAFVPVPRVGWVLAHTRAQAPLEAELRDRFVANAALVALILLLAALLVIAIAERLTRPLARLAQTASVIAEGKRVPVPVEQRGGVEVQRLSSAMAQMVDAVSRREDEQRFLAEASEILGGSLDYAATLAAVVRLAVRRFADISVVDLVEGGELERVEYAYSDPRYERVARLLSTELAPRLGDERHVVVRAIRSGEPVVVPFLSDELLVAAAGGDERRLALYRETGMRSYMIVPLQVRGATIGALTFAARDRRYGDADLALARDLARRAAAAIDNARLFHDVQLQLRTRDEFLSAAAHELKTPLTTIKGFAQLIDRVLSTQGVDRDALARGLRRIDDAATRMTRSVDDLLDVARMQLDPSLRLDRSDLDLVALVRDVTAQQEITSDRHTIHVDAPERLDGTWDRARLERVLLNLLANAIKFSPDGGRIDVRVRDAGPAAAIEIADQGIGIPPEDLPRIFERFHRGSNVVGRIAGTGIGLSLVRQIVEQHGGTVSAESAPGGGATFRLTLPKRPGQPPA